MYDGLLCQELEEPAEVNYIVDWTMWTASTPCPAQHRATTQRSSSSFSPSPFHPVSIHDITNRMQINKLTKQTGITHFASSPRHFISPLVVGTVSKSIRYSDAQSTRSLEASTNIGLYDSLVGVCLNNYPLMFLSSTLPNIFTIIVLLSNCIRLLLID